jgi:hypothetical protein
LLTPVRAGACGGASARPVRLGCCRRRTAPRPERGRGQATLPGLEPGPSTDGVTPNGQGGRSLPPVDATAGPLLSRAGRETCRLSSRLQGVGRPVWPPGHALARNWRRASFACPLPVYQERHPSPRGSTPRVCVPRIGTLVLQPGARLAARHGDAPPRALGSDHGGPAFRVRRVGCPVQPVVPRRATSGTVASGATADLTTAPDRGQRFSARAELPATDRPLRAVLPP